MSREPPPRLGFDWAVVRAIVAKDLRAISRSRATMLPMLLVPFAILVVLPAIIAIFTRSRGSPDLSEILNRFPTSISGPILALPPAEQLIVLVNGYLVAPLFLIVPLMVSAVLAADAFAGEKERRTIETLLHSPVRNHDLFLGKLLVAFIPSVGLSWIGFVLFALVSNVIAWPVLERVFVPTGQWLVVILWVTPAVACFGLGILVRVSARAATTQEANQLGGAVIMPVIIIAVGQTTGLLLVDLSVTVIVGAVIWVLGLLLARAGMRRFTRDWMASRI